MPFFRAKPCSPLPPLLCFSSLSWSALPLLNAFSEVTVPLNECLGAFFPLLLSACSCPPPSGFTPRSPRLSITLLRDCFLSFYLPPCPFPAELLPETLFGFSLYWEVPSENLSSSRPAKLSPADRAASTKAPLVANKLETLLSFSTKFPALGFPSLSCISFF